MAATASTVHPLRAKALRRWADSDPVLHAIAKETKTPYAAMDTVGPFEALVQSIAHQQVSLAAGRTIFSRVQAASGGKATAEGLLAAGPDDLRAAGLSRPKVSYVLDLADRVARGALVLDSLEDAPDERVVEQLVAVKGIGVWSAKMFLLFHLERPDVLPHEDLGLQVAVSMAYGVPRKKAAEKMRKLAPAWSPYASYASLVMWRWRRDLR